MFLTIFQFGLSHLARLLVDLRCVCVTFFNLIYQQLLLSVLLAIHLLHTLLIRPVKVIDINFLSLFVNLSLCQLCFFLGLLFSKLRLAFTPKFFHLIVALVKSLLVSFIGEDRRGLLLRHDSRALFIDLWLEARLVFAGSSSPFSWTLLSGSRRKQ